MSKGCGFSTLTCVLSLLKLQEHSRKAHSLCILFDIKETYHTNTKTMHESPFLQKSRGSVQGVGAPRSSGVVGTSCRG